MQHRVAGRRTGADPHGERGWRPVGRATDRRLTGSRRSRATCNARSLALSTAASRRRAQHLLLQGGHCAYETRLAADTAPTTASRTSKGASAFRQGLLHRGHSASSIAPRAGRCWGFRPCAPATGGASQPARCLGAAARPCIGRRERPSPHGTWSADSWAGPRLHPDDTVVSAHTDDGHHTTPATASAAAQSSSAAAPVTAPATVYPSSGSSRPAGPERQSRGVCDWTARLTPTTIGPKLVAAAALAAAASRRVPEWRGTGPRHVTAYRALAAAGPTTAGATAASGDGHRDGGSTATTPAAIPAISS